MKKDEIDRLLGQWEEVYKKGLLSFWLLLILHERPHYPYEVGEKIRQLSQQAFTVDGNSVYRALSRLDDLGVTVSQLQNSGSGPARRYYRLTEKGLALLAAFIQRNIILFSAPPIVERIQAVLDSATSENTGGQI